MIRPLNQNIVVEVKEIPKTTASGIILSGTASTPTHVEGIVLNVGAGRLTSEGTRIPLSVVIGDRIMFNDYSGKKVTHEGKEYIILSEDDVLAIISK